MEAKVINHAPDSDVIIVCVGEWEIIVGRDESGDVTVSVCDHDEGSETHYTLGKEGETQRL